MSENYDYAIGFDYTNADEWLDFVKKQILPLQKPISEIIKLRENIKQLFDNNFSGLIKDDINIQQILLGGIDEDGKYKPNSLAKLYKETLGISINPKEWIAYCKQSGIDASDFIKYEFSDTVFLQFIKEIKGNTDKLLAIVEINMPEINDNEVREIIKNPEKIVEKLKVIYTSLIHISANYNYHTFLIINTRCIPRFYIEQAYPKFKINFEKVIELLSLEPKFTPNIDEELKNYYTMWGHKVDGFADLVYKLNNTIWKYFSEENYNIEIGRNTRVLAPIFGTIGTYPNLRTEYFEKCEKLVPENKFSDVRAFYFTKNNDLYLEMYSGDSRSFVRKGSTTITELLWVISPQLFLGVTYLVIQNNPIHKYETEKVGYVKSLYCTGVND